MNRVCSTSLEMVDAVSPILKAITTMFEAGVFRDDTFVLPHDLVQVVLVPGSTKAILVPSVQLLGLLALVTQTAAGAMVVRAEEAEAA